MPLYRVHQVASVLFLLLVHSSVLCVRIEPNFEVISDRIVAIWNTDSKFLICLPDNKEFGGVLRWFGPNRREVGVTPLSSVYQVEGQRSNRLFFVKPYKISAGVYECKHIRNDTEVNSEAFEMKIFSPIDMTANNVQYKIDEGSDINIECSAKFDSEMNEAQVTWVTDSNKKNLVNSNRHQFDVRREDLNMEEVVIKNTLRITNVSRVDAGQYQCQAIYSNDYLSDIKTVHIELLVQSRPKLVGSPKISIWIDEQDQNNDDDFILTLKCQAHADPIAHFTWFVGDVNLTANPERWPSIIPLQTKTHLSLLKIQLRNMDKFKNLVKQLRHNNTDIWCESTNIYGTDSLHFDIGFGTLPEPPEILYFQQEPGHIFLEINFTNPYPAIDTFKLQLSDSNYILFNWSHKIEPAKTGHLFKIPFDSKTKIEYLDLLAHNPVGWSRASVQMQDTSNNLVATTPSEPYQHKLSNVQISVLLFIVFIFITSTSIQVIYFNWCVEDEDTY